MASRKRTRRSSVTGRARREAAGATRPARSPPVLDRQHAVEGLVAARLHLFGEALQPAEFLERPHLRDVRPLAGQLEDQALLLQLAQRLAHRDAAHAVLRHQRALGRHRVVRLPGAADDQLAQFLPDAGIERGRTAASGMRGRREAGRVSGLFMAVMTVMTKLDGR